MLLLLPHNYLQNFNLHLPRSLDISFMSMIFHSNQPSFSLLSIWNLSYRTDTVMCAHEPSTWWWMAPWAWGQPKLHRETHSQNKVKTNMQTQLLYYVKENEGKTDIEWSRMLAAKTDDLSFIPEIHRVERLISVQLSSDT